MKKKTLAGSFDTIPRTQLAKVSGGGRSSARPYCADIPCDTPTSKCPRVCFCDAGTCLG